MTIQNLSQSWIFVLAAILLSGCKHQDNPSGSTGQQQAGTRATATPQTARVEATPPVGDSVPKFKIVEEFSYHWSAQAPEAHFVLEQKVGDEDVGEVTRIRINVDGQQDFVLEAGVDEFSPASERQKPYVNLSTRSLVRAKYAVVLPSSEVQGEPPIVILRSYGRASDADTTYLIGFQPSGQPILLLTTELDLLEVSDLDGDGNDEIAGRPCLSQGYGPDLLTYDPLRVYKIPHPMTSSATISLELTKSYNVKHYYGWAGPDCSEDLAVVLHPPGGGKPVIMKKEDAEKLSEKHAK